MKNSEYNFSKIEPKWQNFWVDNEIFLAKDFDSSPKFYMLDMFPYPSGAGLHIGHPEGYTASDALKRYKMSQGYNVLHPMGWDAFGLPTEQYAIKTGKHPKETTKVNISKFKEQLKQIGLCYDWNREINTTDPSYFKWTQWIFIQLFKKGLAYVEEKPVWFCPELGTVLANEEVLQTTTGPKSERGNFNVERKPIKQWVLKITKYADRLLSGLENLNWPESTKRLQSNWIGRSEGASVSFKIKESFDSVEVFTTRPETLNGATYLVIAPEHPLVEKLKDHKTSKEIDVYVKKAKNKSDLERAELDKTKSGVPLGKFALNPINNEYIPIWIADYVLISYGTGAIMAVPAHDQRDFEFAKKHDIPVKQVIDDKNMIKKTEQGNLTKAYTGSGVMINSNNLDGLHSSLAKTKIVDKLKNIKAGKLKVNYKLRDWLFSRQRYWGEPFPVVWVKPNDYEKINPDFKPEGEKIESIIDNEKYYAVILSENELPVELPEIENYNPSTNGQSPLSKAKTWVNIYFHVKSGKIFDKEQKDTVTAQRETNTMPQWAGSCWYYLRYIDPKNDGILISKDKEAYWKSPDLYIGGSEHAVLHLLYARFWHQVLYELNIVSEPEPFKKLFHQGIILGEDGEKMSKSRGNVVNPEVIIESYGADTLRLYLMFLGPLEAMKPWNTKGIEGISRFLRKLWRLVILDNDYKINPKIDINKIHEVNPDTEKLLHQSIEKITNDYENLSFNTIISQLMILLNNLSKLEIIPLEMIKIFLQLLAPLAPHISEELWMHLGNKTSIVKAKWPVANKEKLKENFTKIIIQVNGKYKGNGLLPNNHTKNDVIKLGRSIEKVRSQIEGKEIIKEIYIPNKILNFVVK